MRLNPLPVETTAAIDTRGQGCRVTMSVSHQNVVDTTSPEILLWDVETYDDLGFHNTTTNTSRLVVPADVSRLLITASAGTSGKGGGITIDYIELLKNGSVATGQSGFDIQRDRSGMTPYPSFVSVCDVAVDDYFEVHFGTTFTTSANILNTASFFACHVLRT